MAKESDKTTMTAQISMIVAAVVVVFVAINII